MAHAQRFLLAVTIALVAGSATAAPVITFRARPTMTVIKPEFTRPGGQPGAMREIAPAKPEQEIGRRRKKTQAGGTPR